jgi:glycosyltransferase involved in cell wall biosynthesis
MNNKKKILFFTDCFIFGGCEIVLINLVNSIVLTNEFEILYFYRNFKEYDEKVKAKVLNQELLHPIRLLSNSSFFYKLSVDYPYWLAQIIKIPFIIIAKSGIYSLINFIILYRSFVGVKPDIVFINNGGYPGSTLCRLAVIASKACKIRKVIFNVNNLAYIPKHFLEKMEDKFINKYVDSFVTASFAAKIRLSNARGFGLEKIFNIPNTSEKWNIPLQKNTLRREFDVQNDSLVIGSVGLLTKRKGMSVLIRSMKIVIEGNPNIKMKLFIFGEGEERKSLESLVCSLGLCDYIHLPGFRSDILNYINDFDIFVLPSISNEDMPYVIIESMMLKKPVIGTRIAGIPEEIENGTSGIIVNPGNEIELADAIHVLVNDKLLRSNYGSNGFDRYRKFFSYEIIVDKYKNLFYFLLNY